MRLIDRIALSRSIKMLLDFILDVLRIFEKNRQPIEDSKSPSKPKKKHRPVKNLVDNILPWRRK